RSGSGDRSEVMAESDPAMCGNEIPTVAQALGGRRPRAVDGEHAGRDPGGVEAVAEEIDAYRGRHDPQRVDRLVTVQREAPQGERRGECQPDTGDPCAHAVVPSAAAFSGTGCAARA